MTDKFLESTGNRFVLLQFLFLMLPYLVFKFGVIFGNLFLYPGLLNFIFLKSDFAGIQRHLHLFKLGLRLEYLCIQRFWFVTDFLPQSTERFPNLPQLCKTRLHNLSSYRLDKSILPRHPPLQSLLCSQTLYPIIRRHKSVTINFPALLHKSSAGPAM